MTQLSTNWYTILQKSNVQNSIDSILVVFIDFGGGDLQLKNLNLLYALTLFKQNKKRKEEKQKGENPVFHGRSRRHDIKRTLLCSDSFFRLSATFVSNDRILLLKKIAHYASMFHYLQEYINLSWKPIT